MGMQSINYYAYLFCMDRYTYVHNTENRSYVNDQYHWHKSNMHVHSRLPYSDTVKTLSLHAP